MALPNQMYCVFKRDPSDHELTGKGSMPDLSGSFTWLLPRLRAALSSPPANQDPDPVPDIPAYSKMAFKDPSKPNHSVIL